MTSQINRMPRKPHPYNAKTARNCAVHDLRAAGWSYSQIARLFEISPARVQGILRTGNWPGLEDDPPAPVL